MAEPTYDLVEYVDSTYNFNSWTIQISQATRDNYDHLVLVVNPLSTNSSSDWLMSINSDQSSSSYDYVSSYVNQSGQFNGAYNTANELQIGNLSYPDSVQNVRWQFDFFNIGNFMQKSWLYQLTKGSQGTELGCCGWKNASPISQITIRNGGGGSMSVGTTMALYGIRG